MPDEVTLESLQADVSRLLPRPQQNSLNEVNVKRERLTQIVLVSWG
jgi:hypothetical protein